MPRSVKITVPPARRPDLLERLEDVDGIVAVLVHAGASLRPPGDLVTVRGTNDAANAVIGIASDLGLAKDGCVTVDEPVALVSGQRRRLLDGDSSEASWEEIDTLLRRDTNPSHNFLALMFFAGAIAGAGLAVDTLHIIVGAMLVAPGFEPLVRIGVGVAGGLGDTARKGLVGALAGYAAVAAGGAFGAAVAVALGALPSMDAFAGQGWVQYWSSLQPTSVLISILAALAGAVVVNSHQTVFATGVMVALALIPAITIFGIGLAAADLALALKGAGRWLVDVVCVVAASVGVFALKRILIGRSAHP